MRISTSMIFDAGVSAINRQTADLLHLQQQVSTGRRIITPADDPVAAARALEVQQAKDVLEQYSTNQGNAQSSLNLEEAQLGSVRDMFGRLRELTVQAGNDPLSASDRRSIAMELRSRFDELMGIANATDASGEYLFSGFQGSTKPFGGNVDAMISGASTEVQYLGDDGQRMLQVSPTRQLAVSDAGNDVFMRIKNGNGYFTTAYAAGNTGTGIADAGNVTDPTTWNALANKDYSIAFSVDAATNPPTTYYDIVDTTTGNSLLTGAAAPAPQANQRVYKSGEAIVLQSQGAEPAFNLGASVTISGEPATGDSFAIAPSTSQSLFKTLATLIGKLEHAPVGAAEQAKFSADIGSALTNLDQAHENILRVTAAVGSRGNELDSLASTNADVTLQYQRTLSNLQDLDWAKALSDISRKQTDLEAAQKSFMMVSNLSLFNYL
ncbi:MAG: flagellar hook-associated protein FlgL [Rhodocyclales bacterium]|nr:flagellar hook-associated protein FlgL [Rhodocyclales bacterium]